MTSGRPNAALAEMLSLLYETDTSDLHECWKAYKDARENSKSGGRVADETIAQVLRQLGDIREVAKSNIEIMAEDIDAFHDSAKNKYRSLMQVQRDLRRIMSYHWIKLEQSPRDNAPIAVKHALMMGACAALLVSCSHHAMKLRPQANLKPFDKSVTDAQIQDVVSDPRYTTRQEQADKLGITERSLYRRLKKLNPEPGLTDA